MSTTRQPHSEHLTASLCGWNNFKQITRIDNRSQLNSQAFPELHKNFQGYGMESSYQYLDFHLINTVALQLYGVLRKYDHNLYFFNIVRYYIIIIL